MPELKVGLLVGREWSLPPKFIDEVNRRDEGVVAEFVKLGGTRMNEPCPYAVIIDRISHEVPYYRSYLKNAVLQGVAVVNNPFMWTADDKFFGASLATKLGVAHPKTVVLPNKEYVPGIVPTESLRNLIYPLGLAQHRRVCRAAVCSQGCARRRLARRLCLPHAGGADQHYDHSGLLTMVVQEFIEWDHYVRCLCLGQDDVLPMKYDPHERKYLVDHDHLGPELGRAHRGRFAEAGAGPGLRHELGGMGDARRRAVCHRLHEPGARHGRLLADAALLRLGGEAMADLAIDLALNPRPQIRRNCAGRRCSEAGCRHARRRDLAIPPLARPRSMAADSQDQLERLTNLLDSTLAIARFAPCCGRDF